MSTSNYYLYTNFVRDDIRYLIKFTPVFQVIAYQNKSVNSYLVKGWVTSAIAKNPNYRKQKLSKEKATLLLITDRDLVSLV